MERIEGFPEVSSPEWGRSITGPSRGPKVPGRVFETVVASDGMSGRTTGFLVLAALLGCDAPAAGTAPEVVPAAGVVSPASPAPTGPATAAKPTVDPPDPADPSDPCTWLTTEELARALSATLEAPTKKKDDARQIATCNWTQTEPFGIVDIGVSLVPGAEAYKTNLDLAPAYFDGPAEPIALVGADKAYLVIKKDPKASVIGMLVAGRFVLIQVAIEGTTADQAQALAAVLAGRVK